eukprot:s2273_g2.t1
MSHATEDATSNAEIRFRWLILAMACHDPSRVDAAIAMALEVGRMKFTRPLYRELMKEPTRMARAKAAFEKAKGTYHPSLVRFSSLWLNQLLYLACSQFLQMEVVCLNGKSVLVQPMESLHQVKTKVAKALGASAEAVRVSCAGQVLCGTASLADALAAFQISDEPGPLFGVVDRDRMELSRHLRIFKEDLQAVQKQIAKCVDLQAELTRKRRQLGVPDTSFGEIDKTKEQLKGTLPLQQEKWLLFRLPKLVHLGDLEEKVMHEKFKRDALGRQLENEKIPGLRADLHKALEGSHQQSQLLLEFDEAAFFHDELYIGCYGCDCPCCCPQDDAPNVLRDLVFLQDICPRLLHQDIGRNSKRSRKQVPKKKLEQLEPCNLCDCGSDEWQTRLRPKSKRNQKYNRSAMRHVKTQLSKLSLGHSSEEC